MSLESGCKWRCKSLVLTNGGSFAFPIESPAGGCVVKFVFQVHDGSSVRFDVVQAEQELHTAVGSSIEGVVRVADPGLVTIQWVDLPGLLSFGSRTLTYEVILVPLAYLALLDRRSLLHHAAQVTRGVMGRWEGGLPRAACGIGRGGGWHAGVVARRRRQGGDGRGWGSRPTTRCVSLFGCTSLARSRPTHPPA